MDSYIEISLLHNVATIWLSCMVAKYVNGQPIADKKIILYACTIATLGSILWFPYAWGILLIVEVSFFFFCFRFTYKAYIGALCFRYLCYLTTFLFYQGGFHNFLWFVPIQAFIYPIWSIYGIVYALLARKWKDCIVKLSYVYQIQIHVQDHTLQVLGYLDSGNLLTYQNIPVLFIDKKYQSYFCNQRIELVVRNSISDMDVIRCYECEMTMEGSRRHQVLISCESNMALPMKCEVLLNMKVITQG